MKHLVAMLKQMLLDELSKRASDEAEAGTTRAAREERARREQALAARRHSESSASASSAVTMPSFLARLVKKSESVASTRVASTGVAAARVDSRSATLVPAAGSPPASAERKRHRRRHKRRSKLGKSTGKRKHHSSSLDEFGPSDETLEKLASLISDEDWQRLAPTLASDSQLLYEGVWSPGEYDWLVQCVVLFGLIMVNADVDWRLVGVRHIAVNLIHAISWKLGFKNKKKRLSNKYVNLLPLTSTCFHYHLLASILGSRRRCVSRRSRSVAAHSSARSSRTHLLALWPSR